MHVVLEAGKRLTEKRVRVRVVRMPGWGLFEKAPRDYQVRLLLAGVEVRIAAAAGITMGWERYDGDEGAFDQHRLVQKKMIFSCKNNIDLIEYYM